MLACSSSRFGNAGTHETGTHYAHNRNAHRFFSFVRFGSWLPRYAAFRLLEQR
jgi:hypothetical protein